MTAPIEKITRKAEQIIADKGPSMLVPWYLIASYAYYILDDPVITDALYDRICRELLDGLDMFLIEHEHMDLCDIDVLKMGSGFHLKEEDFPSRAKSVARRFIAGEI